MEHISNAYQLVAAHHGHNAEGLDAVLLRVERWARAIVSENNKGVHLGVQVGDPDLIVDNGIFETRLRLSIAAAAAPSVFASATLLAIAIDVHVDELLAISVQVDDAGRGIFAVSKCCSCRRLQLSCSTCGGDTAETKTTNLCYHYLDCGSRLGAGLDICPGPLPCCRMNER
jgi:hypothetical protein